MNGREHYEEAERLLEQAAIDARDPMRKYAEDANLIAAAQVHATLAMAFVQAAIYGSNYDEPLCDPNADPWSTAAPSLPADETEGDKK